MEKETKLSIHLKGEKMITELVGEPEDIAAIITHEMIFNPPVRDKMIKVFKLLYESGVTNTVDSDNLPTGAIDQVINKILNKL
jgi:hypothetical protein